MKGGHGRYKLKTKTVHGVRTGMHNNPHVMKAAARADGGLCDGESKPSHLGRMGRMRAKKADGGGIDWAAGGRGLQGLAGLGMPGGGGGPASPDAPGQGQEDISGAQRLGQGLMAASRVGMGRMHGGIVPPEEPPRPEDTVTGGGGAIMGRGMKRREDGGAVDPRRDEADKAKRSAVSKGLLSAGSAAGVMAARKIPGPLGHIFRGAGAIGAGLGALDAGADYQRGRSIMDDLEREGRKDGGAVGKNDGGPLTAKTRNALPSKSFAVPGRRYPINDANHARNALSRVAQNGTPEEKSEVRSAVKRKFPGIGQGKKDGGGVTEGDDAKVGTGELKQHALEHKMLAKKGD